jgi:hypothetical protein
MGTATHNRATESARRNCGRSAGFHGKIAPAPSAGQQLSSSMRPVPLTRPPAIKELIACPGAWGICMHSGYWTIASTNKKIGPLQKK